MDEAELRAALAKQERRYRGQRYPVELRARVVEWAKTARRAGLTWRSIGERLGLRGETVRRWGVADAEHRASTSVVPVQVVDAERVAVVSPTGWRLEGLTVADATRLMRSLT